MGAPSVVKKSELEGALRLDAEYYQPVYLGNERSIAACGMQVESLHDVVGKVRNGYDYRNFSDSGRPYIRVGDLLFGEVLYRDASRVDVTVEQIRKDVALRLGDVLFSRKGTFGRSAVVEAPFVDSVISSEIMRLRVAGGKVNPYYLSTYLNCRLGFLQVERRTHGVSNFSIGQRDLGELRVIVPDMGCQEAIEALVREAHEMREASCNLYLQAERIVLEELGWEALDLRQPRWWPVPLSRGREVKRLDADHFQPRYDRLIAHLGETGKARPLGEIASYIKRGVQPRYAGGGEVLAINSRYVGKQLINTEQAERTDVAFWDDNPRARAYKHDVIMNSTGWGTIGRTNCVLHDERTVVDNHVTIIRVKEGTCDPVYLAVYLNSRPGLMQTGKWLSGSSGQIELYPGDIARFVVYVPSEGVQARVADLVTQSHDARRKVSTLLEEAKRKVEALIEGATGGQG